MSINWPIVFTGIKTVLDPVAAASWPIAIAAISYAFRDPLSALLNRVKSLSGFGASLVTAASQSASGQQEVAETPGTSVTVTGNTAPPHDPVFDPLDAALLAQLNDVIPTDVSLKLAWAVRQRSISEANRLHEMHYRQIFGSQIRALQALNQIGREELAPFRQFYTEQVLRDPANTAIHRDRTFEQWGEFLIEAGYVTIVEGSDPEIVEITPFGRQFCAWLGATGAFQAKPG
jgi:hypothetical protein